MRINSKTKYLIDEKIIYCIKCPITNEIFFEPVIASNGLTYEVEVIMNHFVINGSENIKDHKPFDTFILTPNYILIDIIKGILEENTELKSQQYQNKNIDQVLCNYNKLI